jgi:hypothetical protein
MVIVIVPDLASWLVGNQYDFSVGSESKILDFTL